MRRLKLKDFIELYVDRNTIITLYERHPYISSTREKKVVKEPKKYSNDYLETHKWLVLNPEMIEVEKEVSYEIKGMSYQKLWQGMEWQSLHIEYCQSRNIEICPYREMEVLKVIHMNTEHCVDHIDLLIEENKELEQEVLNSSSSTEVI